MHRLKGVKVKDWEDLSFFEKEGVPYLVCADAGNKEGKHRDLHLYFFGEPDIAQGTNNLKLLHQTSFRFEDGYPNCEAVAVDASSRSILLATKTDDADASGLFMLPLNVSAGDEIKIAKRIAPLGIRKITSMDISRDGRRAVILGDEGMFEVERDGTESWGEAARDRLRKVATLPAGQWEAVCYGSDDRTLYVTSEKKTGTPLLVLRPRASE